MPVYNVTVKDTSPIIQYSVGWAEGTSDDPSLAQYSGGSFHTTETPGSSATLQFYGSACYIFGAKRSNHGQFSVTLDGSTQNSDGFSDPAQFQVPLYTKIGLNLSIHNLTITNGPVPGQFVDIDWIDFTSGDGNSDPSDPATNTTFDDTSTAISYLPTGDSAWSTGSSSVLTQEYFNSSLHETTQQGAQARLSFKGNAAYIFGSTNSDHGAFSVSINNQTVVNLNGTAMSLHPQVLLFYAANLGPEDHTITLTNTGQNQNLDLDFIEISTYASSAATSTPTEAGKSKTPIIAGAVSGACVGLAWMIAIIMFFLRRKKRRAQYAEHGHLLDKRPDAYILPPDPAIFQNDRGPGGPYIEQGQLDVHLPLRPLRTKRVEAMQDRYDNQPRDSGSASGPSRGSQSYNPPSSSDAQEPPRAPPPIPLKPSNDQHVRSPSSNNSSTPSQPEVSSDRSREHARLALTPEELATSRMQVPDRPQDWGPIETEDLLPPNYQQATEPMPTRDATA